MTSYPQIAVLLLTVAAAATSATAEPSPNIVPYPKGIHGTGVTTRYWDCCKPSCAWADLIHTPTGIPIASCEVDGVTKAKPTEGSGCGTGGTAYACTNQSPFVINSTLSYGFAAASFTGGLDLSMCCSCMLLSFQGQLKGKQFLVQVLNAGDTLQQNQFDLAMPGGGVGIFPLGCMSQWNATESGWGDQYGGVHTIEECDQLPKALQPGCKWRFEFMEGVSNPDVTFYQVKCPKELVQISGCEL